MDSLPYIAQFGTSSSEFYTLALKWPAPPGPMLPTHWWRILRAKTDVDFALRITAEEPPTVLLFLTAERKETLQAIVTTDFSGAAISQLEQPHRAKMFDTMTDLAMLREHIRTHHEGYQRDGQPLACDFRIYSVWAGQGLADGVGYQISLRANPTGPEQKRRVLKYLAWLDLEQPFTEAVREMQKILCRRLLEKTWLADEYLLFRNEAHREAWQERIQTHFSETTGRIGFSEAPLEVGNFSDWLVTGCHTLRDNEIEYSLPVEAAYAFSVDEIAWLSRQNWVAPATGTRDTIPDVFISYASADFAQADATRQYLENGGRHCWIAPRDINISGLPYTEAIPQAIRQVRAIVVLLSPSANLSIHIPRELDLALEHKLPVVPLRLDDILPAGQLEYLLRTCQWLDGFERDHGSTMRELDARLSSLGI